jgi:type VI secretion system protein ImpC
MPNLQTSAAASSSVEESDALLLERIADAASLDRDRVSEMLRPFIKEIVKGSMTIDKDVDRTIASHIARIDHLVSIQLNEILHHPDFQKLEASWRGLKYLLDQSETGTMLKIRVLNCTKKELQRDIERASEFDQSALFKKVYTEQFDQYGGVSFGVLIGDFEFGKHPQDIELLEGISKVAAAAHAPFLSAASPDLLGLRNWTELPDPRDMAVKVDTVEFAKWRSFRQSEDSRYVALCLPRVLGRLPYGKDTKPIDGFGYEEAVTGSEHSKYLWMNAAYALGTRMSAAFSKYGMCVAMRGHEGGGLVEGLPQHIFETERGEKEAKCPTEILIPDRREKELADLGFVPLLNCKDTDYAAFFSVQSCQKPKVYYEAAATANARLSAQLPYLMACCRFAHYLRAMMREKIGTYMSKGQAETFLNDWIRNYVTPDDTATQAQKAERPLREARIDVTDDPAKPGVYKAIAFLRPHFQLDELTVSLRLVAELPAPTGK